MWWPNYLSNAACPDKCEECSGSGTKTVCKAGKCEDGFGKSTDGACTGMYQPCLHSIHKNVWMWIIVLTFSK
jgi:hypothetical protein